MLNKDTVIKRCLLVLGLTAIDQASKFLFLKYSYLATLNQNLAFSLKFINPLILNVSTLILFLAFIFFYYRKNLVSIPVILVVSGAISNIIDRCFREGVVDFIDFKIWPSFNVADSLIFIGSVLLIIELTRKR